MNPDLSWIFLISLVTLIILQVISLYFPLQFILLLLQLTKINGVETDLEFWILVIYFATIFILQVILLNYSIQVVLDYTSLL